MALSDYIPTNSVGGVLSLHILSSICVCVWFFFFYASHSFFWGECLFMNSLQTLHEFPSDSEQEAPRLSLRSWNENRGTGRKGGEPHPRLGWPAASLWGYCLASRVGYSLLRVGLKALKVICHPWVKGPPEHIYLCVCVTLFSLLKLHKHVWHVPDCQGPWSCVMNLWVHMRL